MSAPIQEPVNNNYSVYEKQVQAEEANKAQQDYEDNLLITMESESDDVEDPNDPNDPNNSTPPVTPDIVIQNSNASRSRQLRNIDFLI